MGTSPSYDPLHQLLTHYRPPSVSALAKGKASVKDDGMPLEELDDATKKKAEARFFNFYEINMEVDPEAQGPANFH